MMIRPFGFAYHDESIPKGDRLSQTQI
jgi:hypothetical protein